MGHLDDFLLTILAGMVCGFVVSVPVGPVNLTVINQALRRGFASAFLTGVGAILAETVYAALMLAGHSRILDQPAVALTLRIVAVAVMALLGFRSLLVEAEQVEAASVAAAVRIDERWHHPKTFLLGFLLTISNVVLVLLWATLAAMLLANEWVQPAWSSRAACLGGVFAGGVLWFFLLAFLVSRAHRRISPRILARLARVCGVVFLLFAAGLAYRLVVPARGVDLPARVP